MSKSLKLNMSLLPILKETEFGAQLVNEMTLTMQNILNETKEGTLINEELTSMMNHIYLLENLFHFVNSLTLEDLVNTTWQ